MRRAETDPENVQMSDVLCDFCHREWTEDIAMVEGHHGSCICGPCLAVAFRSLAIDKTDDVPHDYGCTLCLETGEDRATLDRGDEPGWQSPAYPDAVVCRRCTKRAAGALHKDPDFDWSKPG